jgi:deoxyribonuclease IV
MIKFGTGGMPLTTHPRTAADGVRRVRELGLDAMELEFVYQIFVKEDDRENLKKVAEENNVALSTHGSYYINLASPEIDKWEASIKRVVDGAEAAEQCGAKSITFHPAAFMGREYEDVYSQVGEAMKKIFEEYHKRNLSIRISPELTGKAAQFGDLESLIQLVLDFKGENIGFCFDFAHKHARDGGGWNSYEEFNQMFGTIRKSLGDDFLKNMHMHMSGINYSPKGERNHLTLLSSHEEYKKLGIDVGDLSKHYEGLLKGGRLDTPDIKWQELMQAFKDNNVGGVLICEGPNLEEDALLMQKFYNEIK